MIPRQKHDDLLEFFAFKVDICYLVKIRLPVAQDIWKRLCYLNKVTEAYKVACCILKMARAIVKTRKYVALLCGCRRVENALLLSE
jgi:hypothetical protein